MTDHNELTFFRGRVALYSLLKALGITSNDEVILQAFTCTAVPEAIVATGAKPVYVDILVNSFNMNPYDLAKKINCNTKAIIVQHTFGIPADMDAILGIARKYSVSIIEDCCHVSLSTYKGKRVGEFGIGSFYSYEWGKPIVAGVGGSLKVNSDQLLPKVKEIHYNLHSPTLLRQIRLITQYCAYTILYRPILYWPIKSIFHSMDKIGIAEGNFNIIKEADKELNNDFNLKMAKINEKILLKKLKNKTKFINHSQWVSNQYKTQIDSISVSHIDEPDYTRTVYARYPLLTKNKNDLLKKARKHNIELADWYNTPIHPLNEREWSIVYYISGSCPNAENMCHKIVTLPVGEKVNTRNIKSIIKFLNEVDLC
jgi:dTDP-4-amino-4,6-dideoxygalactose transaminase